jgi:large subunit ribosomal protein L24
MRIRKDDIVVATHGRDAGKSGKVLQVVTRKDRAIVEGVNLVTRHMRKSEASPKGGIIKKEASLALANLMLYCPQCKKGVRTARVMEGEKRLRKCKRCSHAFDQ